FGSRGDIEGALEKIVAAEEGLKRIEQRMESLREISDRESAKRTLEQLIADLRQRITALETELAQSQHSLAEERAQRLELQATLLEMRIDRQQKDPLLASQSRDTIANAQALAARMRAQAKAMRADSKSLSATRSRDTAVIREELAGIEALDHQTSEVIAAGNDRLRQAETRAAELEDELESLRERRFALEERVAQLLEGTLSSSAAQLVSQQFSTDLYPLERAVFILSELHAQQQRDIDVQRQALTAAEQQLRVHESALSESQAQVRSQVESLHSQTAAFERSKAEQAVLL